MAAGLRLFDPGEPEVPVQLSAGRRRTARQRAWLADGRHPLMGGPTSDDPAQTCGTCTHVFRREGGYFKCALRNTRGAGTDIRVSWPGCTRWESDRPVMADTTHDEMALRLVDGQLDVAEAVHRK